MSDESLKKSILEELEWDPRFDAADIGVTVENGVVILLGHVSTYAEKIAAETAVRRVKGVRAIAQEIEVRLDKKFSETSDDQIAQRLANALEWDISLPKEKIIAKVQNGFVTLTGTVDWQYQRRRAEELSRTLRGVKSVINQISLRQRASASDVRKRIEDALRRSAEVEAKAIRVTVADGRVTLDGEVDNWHEREAVENAVWAAPGVNDVEDNLKIA